MQLVLQEFRQGIGAVYAKTRIQRCNIHQIRNCTRFVSYKHIKGFMPEAGRARQFFQMMTV
nr:transposase [[Clostridium] innocuum]